MTRLFAYRPRYYLLRPWEAVQEMWDFFIGGALAFYRRGRRGWAHQDTWNMDIYLARIIAEMLAYLAETGTGYPITFVESRDEKSDHEQWKAYLLEMRAAFADYVKLYDSMDMYDEAKYRACVERMKRLFDYYGALWS